MNSTTIELCLSLSPWAKFHHDKGAAKLHTAIDMAGDLPLFTVITDGRSADIRAAREQIQFIPETTLVFDRGYSTTHGSTIKVWFVTRTKINCVFKVVESRPTDTSKRLTFLTNRFDLATQTICDLYKSRWKVELFFRTMKQNLRVKEFLGTSANAVKAQILVALIAYLLVQILHFTIKTSISIADAMLLLGHCFC